MTTKLTPTQLRSRLAPLCGSDRSVRDLSLRTGISVPTIRQILKDGIVRSHVTAAMLARGTGGLVAVDEISGTDTKGRDLYTRAPARMVLEQALETRTSIAHLLAPHRVTPDDLRDYVVGDPAKRNRLRDAVRSALVAMNIDPTIRPIQQTRAEA